MLLMMRPLMASWLINRTLLKWGNLVELRRFECPGVAVVGVEVESGVGVCSMFSVNIGSTVIRLALFMAGRTPGVFFCITL
jgi:hypothetical protein